MRRCSLVPLEPVGSRLDRHQNSRSEAQMAGLVTTRFFENQLSEGPAAFQELTIS